VFEPDDSGTGGHRVIYKGRAGENPVISGGRAIRGWQAGPGGQWKAAATVDDFRQLYINGCRPSAPGEILRPGWSAPATTATGPASLPWPTGGTRDIEFCYQVVWCHTRCKLQAIGRDGSQAVVTMQQPAFRLARTRKACKSTCRPT